MSVEEELARFSPDKDTLLTIGVFDGVHLGHKRLISELSNQARQRDLMPGVVTFRQHPEEIMPPKTGLLFLTDLTERVNLLKNEDVEIIVTLSFTPKLAGLRARQFCSLLQKYLRMRGLVIGPDFALGWHREGSTDSLRVLGQEMDFTVTVVPPVKINGEVVSSTAIRKALAVGDMKKVTALTGRPFSLHGPVVTGAGRGVELGFPTANLAVNAEHAVPPDGIYVSWANINNEVYPAMSYIGKAPTFGVSKRTVEVYLLDYQSNLYGQELRVDIIEKLRDDKRFDNVEELKIQMAEDVKQGRALLKSIGRNKP